MYFRFLLFGLLVVAVLAACDIQIELLPDHPERIVTGPGRIEPMVHSPRLMNRVSSGGDTVRYVHYDFIVWGEYAHPDTRDNRVIFDAHFCDNIPIAGLDTTDLTVVTYYAGCYVTNNDTIAKYPWKFDDHSTTTDRLRSYELVKGRLREVAEVYNYQQYPEIREFKYTLYCLPDAPADF